MIRLPPTGISLSASDLDVHLHQINIYHGLLKQGFRKKDVLRYFDEQKQAENSGPRDRHEVPADTPTTLDLVTRRLTSPVQPNVLQASQVTIRLVDKNRSISDLWTGDASVEDSSTLTTSHRPGLEVSSSHEVLDVLEPSQMSLYSSDPQNVEEIVQRSLSIDAPNMSVRIRHAPRQSSLLRFAHTMSSDPSEAEDLRHHPVRAEITTGQLSSARSNKKSECEQFIEMFEELVIDNSRATIKSGKWTPSRSHSLLDPEAQEFTPLALPPSFSTTYEGSSSIPSPPSVTRLQIHVSSNVETESTTPSTSSRGAREFPSSPPILQRSTTSTLSLTRAPSTPPVIPTTPMSRHSLMQPESEPQNWRHQHLDGSTFAVYDDSLPANEQPRTPADLSRRPWMSDLNAAYTAPPGARYAIGFQSAPRGTLPDIGEQSPTERAIEIRSRRNREFARSARVEGLRILRARRRSHQAMQNDQPAWLLNGTDVRRDNRGEFDFWRDDLEADRVGEENFIDELDPTRQAINGLRVVSGNERPRGL